MFQWLTAGQEGEKSDSEKDQRVTRSGKLSEKSGREAIKKHEMEELERKLRKRFREAGDKLERDQQPQPGPSGQQQQHQTTHLPTPATDELQSENTSEALTGGLGGSGGGFEDEGSDTGSEG